MDLGEFNARMSSGPCAWSPGPAISKPVLTQSVEARTERGDIELSPATLPLAAIEARSGTGKIELLLPEKAAFQLDATAERGDAVNDFGPPLQQDQDGRAATLKGRVGDGPLIKLTAKQGTIAVRKDSGMPAEAPPKSVSPKSLKDSETKM